MWWNIEDIAENSCIKRKMDVVLRLLLYCRYFGPLFVGKWLSQQSKVLRVYSRSPTWQKWSVGDYPRQSESSLLWRRSCSGSSHFPESSMVGFFCLAFSFSLLWSKNAWVFHFAFLPPEMGSDVRKTKQNKT